MSDVQIEGDRDGNRAPSPVRIVSVHPKAGFLLIGAEVFAYRFSESNTQLTITNRDGQALFPVLQGEDAKQALATIQNLPK
jgi:hypothetical protein